MIGNVSGTCLLTRGINNIASWLLLVVVFSFCGSVLALDLGGMLKKIDTTVGAQPPVEKRETAQEQHERALRELQEAAKKREAEYEEQKRQDEIQTQKEEAEREERRIADQKEAEKKVEAKIIALQKEQEQRKKDLEEGYKIEVQLANKLFAALKSPMLNKAYTACQNTEVARLSRQIQLMKEQAKLAKTVAQRDRLLKQVTEGEKNVYRVAPATCWVRMYAKSKETLDINDNGARTGLKDVLAPIVDALERNEFTSNFYSELANDLQNHDHVKWFSQPMTALIYGTRFNDLVAGLVDNPDYIP